MTWESPLLERESETRTLQRALDQVTETGSGQVVLVEAEAGLGKTRLLRELRTAAHAAAVPVLSARGSALETTYVFGVARQLLERAAREWTGADPALTETVRRVLDPTAGSSRVVDGDRR